MKLHWGAVVPFCLSALFAVMGTAEAVLGRNSDVLLQQGATLAVVGGCGLVFSLALSHHWTRRYP